MKKIFILLAVLALAACQKKKEQQRGVIAHQAMVVSAHPLASQAGVAIMKQGGNAIDASIATQFALAVVFPAAGNIGGGGFMLTRFKNGEFTALDYRETAPSKATTNMYWGETGEVIAGKSTEGHWACGVPGTVAGLVEAHKKYGKLPWKTLVQPAIDLALKGFPLTQKEAKGLNELQPHLAKNNTVLPEFLMRKEWKQGDTIRWTDLGHTLERIRDLGNAGFYEGETAKYIVEEMNRGKGLMTAEDLKNYKAVWRKPISCFYRNYKVTSMPPPSSGGVALIQLLKSIEPYPIEKMGWNKAETVHLLVEAERRVYADRAKYLGDPDFVNVPLLALMDSAYNQERMKSMNPKEASRSRAIQEGNVTMESEQTTHLSVVDAEGNAVSCTTTLNNWYGSYVVVAGAGFFMNNEMDDFSIKPGTPNMYGAIGGEANKILPGKRMLSSMTPTIIEKGGKLYMVVGTPGGTTIITSVFQTIQNVLDHKMTMQEAVQAKRFHSQWVPDSVYVEANAFSKEDSVSLVKMNHYLRKRRPIGRVDAILVLPDGTYEGGADPRGDDAAIGF